MAIEFFKASNAKQAIDVVFLLQFFLIPFLIFKNQEPIFVCFFDVKFLHVLA